MQETFDTEPPKKIKGYKHRSKLGSEPGTMVSHPDLAQQGVQMSLIAYNSTDLVDKTITDPAEVTEYLNKYPITWLNVCGLGDVDLLQKIAGIFKLNALAMEDVVNVHQRPKIEEYDTQYFAVARIPEYVNHELNLPQISFFWGKNFVITFLERPTDSLNPLIARLKQGGRRQLMLKPEYFSYSLLDTVIDQYFPVLDIYAEQLDTLEEAAIDNPSSSVIYHIHNLKHDLHLLRRAIWSQREALGDLRDMAAEYDIDMRYFIRDCEDHTIQLLDVVESYRDRVSGLMDIYLSSVSNRTNRIVKLLTIIATIFMPIGVCAGIYGMNFDRSSPWNMPELSWHYGYEYFWCLIIIIASSLIFTFWRKGWFKH
jgi:magnesium transporter